MLLIILESFLIRLLNYLQKLVYIIIIYERNLISHKKQ